MKKPRLGGDGRGSRADAEREAQEELNRLTRGGGPPPAGAGAAARRSSSASSRAFTPSSPVSPSRRPSFTPGPPAQGAQSSRPSFTPGPPAQGAQSRRPSFSPSSAASAIRRFTSAGAGGAPPEDHRSPGFGGGRVVQPDDEYDEYEDEDEDEYDDDTGVYSGPTSAREEEEAITGMALRDLAANRGKERWEDVAVPRFDRSSMEAQRDRALREIVERQERMKKEYREQTARLQPVEGETVADPRAAHQMNVLRRGKPPGMMNMAAAQTGNFNRQYRERMATAAAEEEGAPKGRGKAAKAAKKAPAKKAGAAADTAKASAPAKAKAPVKATREPAAKPAAARASAKSAAAKATPTKTTAAKAPAAPKRAAAKTTPAPKPVAKKMPAAKKAPAAKAPAKATRKAPAATRAAAPPAPEPTPAASDATAPPKGSRRAAQMSPIARAAAALARREADLAED